MRKILIGLSALGLFIFLVWLAGVRVIVIQPIGAIPNGVTAIVIGVPNANFIDSPDAICNRTQAGVSLMCRGMTAGAIAQNGTILLRLPYSSILYSLSGAPVLER